MADTATLDRQPLADDSSPRNLATAALYEAALKRGEAQLSEYGALVVDTGRFTGRSPNDKYLVKNALTSKTVDWGEVNQAITPAQFDTLRADMERALDGKELFIQDLYVGADPRYRMSVRVISEYAWHSLFARNMFVRPDTPPEKIDYTVIDLPSFRADPKRHGCCSDTLIAMSLAQRLVLIGNTEYAGEIKKSIFSAMNFELPERNVMPMHCSANAGPDGSVALFFGLSGTGKTTLSADAERTLIGDDEHGWSEDGVFNFEEGCYAKVINLSAEAEPEIFSTTKRFGTILENVIMDPQSRRIDYRDGAKTENTRASYPIDFIPNASGSGVAGHPSAVIFLTADAFGVLPPISKLSPEQAMYHFLSGYTAKVAGTERGVTEPEATFSACFGDPFMPRPASVYAKLLGEKIKRHGAQVWLVNTGWTGGPYGIGSRIKLSYTRAMVNAALSGELASVPSSPHPIFEMQVPERCPGVPQELLDPRRTWADGEAYDAQARKLAAMFETNFERFRANLPPEVKSAGPRVP